MRPTFAQALAVLGERVPKQTVNVEVKYPSNVNGTIGQRYWSRQTVLEETLRALDRTGVPAYFSSFDPVTVLLLHYGQNKYPVFYLNDGYANGPAPPDGLRYLSVVHDISKGIDFAAQHGLQGLVVSLTIVRNFMDQLKRAISMGLKVCSWGTIPGDETGLEARQREAGMEVLLYDLVHLASWK